MRNKWLDMHQNREIWVKLVLTSAFLFSRNPQKTSYLVFVSSLAGCILLFHRPSVIDTRCLVDASELCKPSDLYSKRIASAKRVVRGWGFTSWEFCMNTKRGNLLTALGQDQTTRMRVIPMVSVFHPSRRAWHRGGRLSTARSSLTY